MKFPFASQSRSLKFYLEYSIDILVDRFKLIKILQSSQKIIVQSIGEGEDWKNVKDPKLRKLTQEIIQLHLILLHSCIKIESKKS